MKNRKQETQESARTPVGDKISHILRQARTQKHYSLGDLSRITKIKLVYLKAIDSGEFKKIPEGFYLRAYIKKYADVVGINGTELLKRFNNELPDLQDPNYINKISEDKLWVRSVKQRVQNRHSTVRKYIPLAVMSVAVFFILICIWVVASRSHSNLSSNYHDHSTSVSGESSIKRVKHKKRSRKSKKARVLIKKPHQTGNRLVYKIATAVHPLNLHFVSSDQTRLILKNGQKVLSQSTLKPKQSKSIKLSKRSQSVQLNLATGDRVKMKLDHRTKQLKPKRNVQSIILKFSK